MGWPATDKRLLSTDAQCRPSLRPPEAETVSPSADASYGLYGTRSIEGRLREPVRRSNSSWRAVICVYAGFLILHQLVLVPSAW